MKKISCRILKKKNKQLKYVKKEKEKLQESKKELVHVYKNKLEKLNNILQLVSKEIIDNKQYCYQMLLVSQTF